MHQHCHSTNDLSTFNYVNIITSDQMILNLFSSVLDLSENWMRAIVLSSEKMHMSTDSKRFAYHFFLQSSWGHP